MTNFLRLNKAIQQVREGDQEAFGEVISETVVTLRAYVNLFVYDHHLVDDVLHEVYLRVYQQLGDYKPEFPFIPWIKAIARNVAMSARNQLLREKNRFQRYQNELLDYLSNEAQTEENVYQIEKRFQSLQKCMEHLENRARSWVDQHYFQGLSFEVIASTSGTSANVVAVGLHRARKSLASCIAIEGGKT